MYIYVIYNSGGEIQSVYRQDEPQNDSLCGFEVSEDCFVIDISGQKEFAEMQIIDIHNNYTVDVKTKKLVKR